jgi:hypothetical protein
MNRFILAGIIVIGGFTLFSFRQHESVEKLRQQNLALLQELSRLAAENERLSNSASLPRPGTPQQASQEPQDSQDDRFNELLRLRAEVATLRRLTNVPARTWTLAPSNCNSMGRPAIRPS